MTPAKTPPPVFHIVSRTPPTPEMVAFIQRMVDDAFALGRTAGRDFALAQLAEAMAKSRKPSR